MPASRVGKVVPYKPLLDEAIALCQIPAGEGADGRPRPRRRIGAGAPGATSTTPSLRAQHMDAQVPCVWLESNEPSYILYTSGTTGKPKGVQRDTGGYAVALAASMQHIFCGNAGETYFSTSRHRLGGRPFLHRLRPADRRHGDHHVRGHADPPRSAASGGRSSRSTRSRDVLRAHGDPRAEEAGPGVPDEVRPVLAQGPVPGRRAAGRADRALDLRRRWASRSSTTTGRPRPAGRSSPTRRASRTLPRKFGSPGFPVYGYDVQLLRRGHGRGGRRRREGRGRHRRRRCRRAA